MFSVQHLASPSTYDTPWGALIPPWCRAALGSPCDRQARPGRSDGLCDGHRRQIERGKPLTPLRPYKKQIRIGLPGWVAEVLDDLTAHGGHPYDRTLAAGRLGWTNSRRVGKALAVLAERGVITARPRKVLRHTSDGKPIMTSTAYRILGLPSS